LELQEAVQNAMRSKRYDEARLKKLAEAALNSVAVRTANAISSGTAQDASATIERMLCMVKAMARYGEASDGDFLEVRARLRSIAADFVRAWEQLGRQPVGDDFQQLSWEYFTQVACRSMVIAIGEQLRARKDGRKLPPVELVPPNSVPYEFTLLPIKTPEVFQ
jgi:hypothetical protein